MPNEDVLLRIESKLDQMIRLAALQMTSGIKQTLAIELLASAGLDRRLIADLLNTTPNTVSVTLSTSKAKSRAAGRMRKTDSSRQGSE